MMNYCCCCRRRYFYRCYYCCCYLCLLSLSYWLCLLCCCCQEVQFLYLYWKLLDLKVFIYKTRLLTGDGKVEGSRKHAGWARKLLSRIECRRQIKAQHGPVFRRISWIQWREEPRVIHSYFNATSACI